MAPFSTPCSASSLSSFATRVRVFVFVIVASNSFVLIAQSLGEEKIFIDLSVPNKVEVSIKLTDEARALGSKPKRKAAQQQLSMHLKSEGKVGPAIFGTYSVTRTRLVFAPRFKLTAGALYEVRARVDGCEVTRELRLSRDTSRTAEVTHIAPSVDQLPANHMKFYVYFSQPMREGREIFDSLQIFDEKGVAVKDPWRRVDLWDSERKRLTLWIHPGRIKQGLNLREDYGPVLRKGKTYTLKVLTTLKDQAGNPLKRAYSKKFTVTSAIHSQVLPQKWRLSNPVLGTNQPLRVQFDRSLDPVLCRRMLTVYDQNGKQVDGKLTLTENETGCQFAPVKPWAVGRYELRVHSQLEDLAGNTPLRVFDTDLQTTEFVTAKLRVRFEAKKKTKDADASTN